MSQILRKSLVNKYGVLFFLSSLMVGCVSDSSFKQAIRIKSNINIINVYVFLGEEKSWWPYISKGDSKQVNLYPKVNGELSVIYEINGDKRSFTGPVINIFMSNEIYLDVTQDDIWCKIN